MREEFDEHWRETIRRIVREGQASGEFEGVSAEEFAVGFSALLDGFAIQIALDDPVVNARLAFELSMRVAAQQLGFSWDDGAGRSRKNKVTAALGPSRRAERGAPRPGRRCRAPMSEATGLLGLRLGRRRRAELRRLVTERLLPDLVNCRRPGRQDPQGVRRQLDADGIALAPSDRPRRRCGGAHCSLAPGARRTSTWLAEPRNTTRSTMPGTWFGPVAP